jgi:hypothetical protein
MSMLALTNSGDVRNLLCSNGGLLRVALAPPIEMYHDIGAVAANATVIPTVIDLDATEHQHTLFLALKLGVASSGEYFAIEVSADGLNWYAAHNAAGTNGGAGNGSSGYAMYSQGRPLGRYVRLRYVNGSTPQTSLKLYLKAFAGV